METGDIYLASLLFCLGFVIYLAKSIASGDQDSWSVILAKAVLNGVTSLFAGALLLYTAAPMLAVVALAAILGTLGSEVVIKIARDKLERSVDTLQKSINKDEGE